MLTAFEAPFAATAQVGAAVSFFSDDRFRGYSVSDSRPVGVFDLSYDASNGLYGAISASVVGARNDGVQPLGLQLNAGYANRLKSDLTVDLGLVHSNYSSYSSRARGRAYTEAYAGLSWKIVSTRLSVSPDYLGSSSWSAYAEADGNAPIWSKLRLIAHIGALVPLKSHSDGQSYRPEFDWRVGFARDFDKLTVSATWTGVHPGRDIYQEPVRSHRALVLGISCAL